MSQMTPDYEPEHARRHSFRRWPLFLIAAPAAVAVWSGWVGLGALAGFGIVHPLPGIVTGFQLNTAITLPVGVEAYGAYALGVWLAPFAIPAGARTFARRSALGALALGLLGQVSYHLLARYHATGAPWLVVVAVSCMPVITLGFGVALTHLLRAGDGTEEATVQAMAQSQPVALPESQASATPEATAEPEPVPAIEPPGEPEPEPLSATVAEPEAMPVPEPREPRRRPLQDQEAKSARDAYRKSVRQGVPLSDRELGKMFGRSRTWGASRIKECAEGPRLAEAK